MGGWLRRALVLQSLFAWPEEINGGMCLSLPAPGLVLALLKCCVATQACIPLWKSQLMTVSLGPVSVSSEYPMHRAWLKPAVSVLTDCSEPGLCHVFPMRLMNALHFFQEHWVMSICSKQLSGLEIIVLVHQFLNAENKLFLWL